MSETQFREGIRAAVRGLWLGVLGVGDFDDSMEQTLKRHLRQAWKEGALECGIDELSEKEEVALAAFLVEQYKYIPDFTVAIVDNRKSKEPNLKTLYSRIDLWVNRYGEARNQGKVMACSDQKLKWVINYRKGCREHCSSCMRLNGKVKRASYWQKTILPRSGDLECGGYRCCCELVPTTDPLSKGRLSF